MEILNLNTILSEVLLRQEECHMTQKELAEKTGINQADISKIETGNANPTLSTLKKTYQRNGYSPSSGVYT